MATEEVTAGMKKTLLKNPENFFSFFSKTASIRAIGITNKTKAKAMIKFVSRALLNKDDKMRSEYRNAL